MKIDSTVKIIRAAVYATCILLLSGCLSPTQQEVLRTTRMGAWVTYWDFAQGVDAVESSPGAFDDVFFFVANLDRDGHVALHRSINEEQLRASVKRLSNRGIRAWLTVVNDVSAVKDADMTLKDPAVVRRILDTDEARSAHIRDLMQITQAYGFAGIDIDYENLPAQDREIFSRFTREMADAAHTANLKLSITVQPKKREMNSVGAGAMDWKALCSAADRMQIMLYNEHSAKTPPGPMATSAWIDQVFDYALTQCPRDKLVPVFKVSGMVWGGNTTKGIQFTDAVDLQQRHQAIAQTDRRGNTPYFSYVDGDATYTAYYEDAASLTAKLYGISRFRVNAVVFWSLGRHDPALVKQLSELRAPAE